MMPPILQLQVGMMIVPRVFITGETIRRYWKYGDECDEVGGGIAPSSLMKLEIVELSPTMFEHWVKVRLPRRTPEGILKISGDELANSFELAR